MAKVVQLTTANPGWRAVFGPEEEARSLPVVAWAVVESEGGRTSVRGLVLWGGIEAPLRDAQDEDSFRGFTAPAGEGPEWRDGFVPEDDSAEDAEGDVVPDSGIPY